jgi:predicted permease
MKRSTKLGIGIATLWPAIHVIAFLIFVSVVDADSPHLQLDSWFLPALFGLHCVVMFWMVLLLVAYLRHLYKNDRVPESKRMFWVLALCFGNILTMPVYWYLFVWKENSQSSVEVASARVKSSSGNNGS